MMALTNTAPARKYRDERRPRHGLLRGREFLMKDLYTFDLTSAAAIETYKQVSAAYRAFFVDLKLPFLVAEASSGDMGGDLSHEYHLPAAVGEDTVVNCNKCSYTANDEVAAARTPAVTGAKIAASQVQVWRGVTQDRKTLVNAWYPKSQDTSSESTVSLHAVKSAVPELDTSIEDPAQFWNDAAKDGKLQVVNVVDTRLVPSLSELQKELPLLPENLKAQDAEQSFVQEVDGEGLNLVSLADGDGCPRCEDGTLKISKALEVGHTFHLGTRYSVPLDASVTIPNTEIPEIAASEGLAPGSRVPVQMGCHGVGVSRIFGAVAELLADEKGLNWPRAIAPFEVAIIPTSGLAHEAEGLYDTLAAGKSGLDVVLDDRKQSFGWKMKDADLIGYPVVVILGKSWKEKGTCEVQCRRLSVKEDVPVDALPQFVSELLDQL